MILGGPDAGVTLIHVSSAIYTNTYPTGRGEHARFRINQAPCLSGGTAFNTQTIY